MLMQRFGIFVQDARCWLRLMSLERSPSTSSKEVPDDATVAALQAMRLHRPAPPKTPISRRRRKAPSLEREQPRFQVRDG